MRLSAVAAIASSRDRGLHPKMRSALALVACRMSLKVPSDDFFQVIHVLPRNRFQHSPSFL
jgi:hypothetical protein